MDPITQGTLGAACALAILGKRGKVAPKWIGWAGALGGMAADLDILIRSSSDPLLAIEYHRHFTHSLAFVPLGGTIAALPWLVSKTLRPHFMILWAASVLGYLTHAPLDCFTTYGTLLFWPFSDERVALSWVSIVDPLYTVPMLLLVVLAARRGARTLARWGLLYGAVYLGLGAYQRSRAMDVQERLAERRGTPIDRSDVFPSFANLVAWRSIYESGGQIYIDQLRVPYIGRNAITVGAKLAKSGTPEGLGPKGQRAHRLLRWFASDWVSWDPTSPKVMADLRYSFEPYGSRAIWGITVDADDQVTWVDRTLERRVTWPIVKNLIFEDPEGSYYEK